jgi:hypothetical protein
LYDGWSASVSHLRHAGREQADDLGMIFTGSRESERFDSPYSRI